MTKQRVEKEFTSEEMESIAQEFRRGMQEEPVNDEMFPNDAVELRDYILTLEENMKHTPTDHLREELRVYKAHQTGIYKGFCFSFEQLMAEADRVKREHPAEEEIEHPKEENAYKHDPNYKFTPLTYADIDKYEAISYGPFLGIPWEKFDKMIKKYCKETGRKGKWKTNEFGTQTFYFKNI